MATFVLEIGSEELPSRFLPVQEAELCRRFTEALAEAGLEYGSIRAMSTPRRASLIVQDMALVQSEREEVITGPPVRAAYGPDGVPTKALEGFARTHGLAVADTFRIQTEKGEYVAVRKKSGGAPARDLLAEICPAVITALSFAKRMHWADHSLSYARPVQWILALLDQEVVSFILDHIQAGRVTYGHRVHGPGPFSIASADVYLETLANACAVTLDPAVRRQCIIQGGNAVAAAAGGKVLWTDDLLDEVQGLVEHPVPLLGSFDPAFLDVPREILLTSMESHQKSFGVEDSSGQLLPYFLTVANVDAQNVETVRHGWERVLRARLEDARFFWQSDLKEDVETWLKQLDSVIFIGTLGSMGQKVRRLESLCRWLANQCDVDADAAARAGRLSKADLVSGMVGEFDTLQGVMGGIYAERRGEAQAVALALKEQYLPAGPDSPLPSSLMGAVLALADKADTLVGCFGLGMIPTGAADPNGLRRCALGIIRILLDFGLPLDVAQLFDMARKLYGEQEWKLPAEDAQTRLMEFFTARLRNYLLSLGHSTLLVEAVLNAGAVHLPDCDARLTALTSFSREPGFAEAVQTFKRVSNIVRKQAATGELPDQWDVALLQEEAEQKLGEALAEFLPRLDQLQAAGKYGAAFAMLREIRPAIDTFFDGVMVVCDDIALRRNRLTMLKTLSARFARLADFAALQV